MLNNFIKKSFSTLKKPSLYNFPDQGQKYDDYRPKYP